MQFILLTPSELEMGQSEANIEYRKVSAVSFLGFFFFFFTF